MGLLDGLVGQIASQALNQNNQQSQGGLGDILGSVLGGATNQNQSSMGGLGNVLGGVLANSMGGNNQGGGLGNVLGGILGNSLGGGQGGNKNMLLAALLPMVLGWIQKQGGLSQAFNQLSGMGMGTQAQSWMSNAPNQSVPPDMMSQLFNSQEINQVAQQTGMGQADVMQGLSALLPEVMNQLTPKGDLQTEGQANQEIGDILGQLAGMMQ